MAAQGQDPSNIIKQVATVIQERQKGRAIEDVIEEVFAPQNPPAGAEQMVEQPSVPSAPGAPAGGALPEAQPREFEGPGMVFQKPELQSLLSSLSSTGGARSSVRTINRRQVG